MFIIYLASSMITYYNEKKIKYYYFTPLLFLFTINEVQAALYPAVWEGAYNQEGDSETKKQAATISVTNKQIYDNENIRSHYMSVYEKHNTNFKKNNIDNFSSSSAYKNFLTRLSVRKNSSEIYKKLFENDIKDKEKKINDNKIMIAEVDKRITRLKDDYNKMVGKNIFKKD